MFEQVINIDRMEQAVALFGTFDENIKLIQNEYMVSVVCRGSEMKITGDPENVAKAVKVIESLLNLVNKGEVLSDQNVRYCMSLVNEGNEHRIEQLAGDCICITSKGRPVKPKTLGQKNYCTAIRKNTVVVGVGPAGTGKTYLAVAMAVASFRAREINRIILTRPAVEAGEKLGFLPGDLTPEKFGYYGVDRYETALNMIGKAGEGFTTEDALAVLDAVKQVQWAPTQVSFVYSQNENRVYYTLQHDFNHIRIHQF